MAYVGWFLRDVRVRSWGFGIGLEGWGALVIVAFAVFDVFIGVVWLEGWRILEHTRDLQVYEPEW